FLLGPIDPQTELIDATMAYHDEDGLDWKSRTHFDEYKKLRSMWKGVSFMILFRGGDRKLARMAFGCTGDVKTGTVCKKEKVINCTCTDRAREYIQNYYEKFDAIKWWQYKTIRECDETGMVRERFGTYRKLPAIHESNFSLRLEAERQACNFPVQRGGV